MFRQKYRKDNELLKAPKKIPEVIMNMTKGNSVKRNTSLRAVAIAAACVVMIAAAVLPVMLGGSQTDPVAPISPVEQIMPERLSDLRTASDYGELYDEIERIYSQLNTEAFNSTMAFGAVFDSAVVREEAEYEKAYKSDPTESADDYSETNTQVKGVDEGDVIKTDGRYIYRLTGNEIVIIDAQDMTVLSRVDPFDSIEKGQAEGIAADRVIDYIGYKGAWINELYVSGDRLVVLYNENVRTDVEWRYDTYTGVLIYDITDRSNPMEVGDFSQSGRLSASRLIGDYIYLVTSYSTYDEIEKEKAETYVPVIEENGACRTVEAGHICILSEPRSADYSVLTSVNIRDAVGFDCTEAIFGYCGTVYADTEVILLAFDRTKTDTQEINEAGENVTVISNEVNTDLIRYDIVGGKIIPTAQGTVPGRLLNQFSMDRYNNVVRVVTTLDSSTQKIYTDGIDRYEFDSSTTNGLYTLDENMEIIGTLDGLAEEERVYSVRFSEDIGYFVTFRQVDPLFAVDLSDPAKPTILSALKIPGFSQYLHPYAEGLLFGLGMDADEETGFTQGLKLSMFDISDPADVTECSKLILEDVTWSEALNNHKAVLISAERDIIAFPSENGYLIYGYGNSGFYKRFDLTLDKWSYVEMRGLFIGDSFYICTTDMLYRYDINTFALLSELEINPAE